MIYLAATTLFLVFAVGVRVVIGLRQIRRLSSVEQMSNGELPSVTIVVAARNEQPNIEAGLHSLLKLDYGGLRIIAINDRSTDQTGDILDKLARESDRLEVIHVQDLPSGWLGKNHALQIGADRTDSQWLLFTDADIVMDPTTLRRAIRYAVENEIDHLPIMPRIRMPHWFLEAMGLTFGLYLHTFIRPWDVVKPHSRAHVGIGAFNLIRTDVYQQIGMHKAIAMRPDDDIKLGKLVKVNGYRQEMMFSDELMYVPWYGSMREMILGLEKNQYSGVDYRLWIIILSTIVILSMHVWPFIAVFVTSGVLQMLYVAVATWLLLLCALTALDCGIRPSCALALPVTGCVFVYIQWRSIIVTYWNGGIRWRDTLYPLSELKANKV